MAAHLQGVELARYHSCDKLSQPEATHEFF